MKPDVSQSLWDHVDALRTHLLLGGGFFVVVATVTFSAFADPMIHYLLAPLHGQPLVFLTVLGPLLFKLKVAFLAGVVASTPVWLALGLNFAAPAMSKRQIAAAAIFVVGATVLAALSVIVTIVYLVPPTLTALLALPVEGTSTLLTADSYLQFIFLEVVVAFIVFQLPLSINALAYFRLIDPRRLAGQRRILYAGLLVGLAVATPTTDAFSLTVVFVPAILFLEFGLATARLIHTPRVPPESVR